MNMFIFIKMFVQNDGRYFDTEKKYTGILSLSMFSSCKIVLSCSPVVPKQCGVPHRWGGRGYQVSWHDWKTMKDLETVSGNSYAKNKYNFKISNIITDYL